MGRWIWNQLISIGYALFVPTKAEADEDDEEMELDKWDPFDLDAASKDGLITEE